MSENVSENAKTIGTPARIPVTVMVEGREGRVGQWVEEQWEAIAVVAGEDVRAKSASSATLIHEDDTCRRYLWTGLNLVLHRDACESYWYNLMSGKPYLFVICHVDEYQSGVDSLKPMLVTADQQEANGHMETDDRVFSVPMPAQVHDWLERFVVTHYVPAQKKKRKRRDWAKESEHDEANRDEPPVHH